MSREPLLAVGENGRFNPNDPILKAKLMKLFFATFPQFEKSWLISVMRSVIPVTVLPRDLVDDETVLPGFLSPYDLVATNSPVVDAEGQSEDPVVNLLNLLEIDQDHPQFEQIKLLINNMPRDIFLGYDELCAIGNIETKTEKALFDDIDERVKEGGVTQADRAEMIEAAKAAVARERIFFLFHLLHYFATEKEMALLTRFEVKRAITNAFRSEYVSCAWGKCEAFFFTLLIASVVVYFIHLPQMPVAVGVGCELSDKVFKCLEYLSCIGNASTANFTQWCSEALWSSGTSSVATCDLLNASLSNNSNPPYVPHNGFLGFNYKFDNDSSSAQSVLFSNAHIVGFVGQILFSVFAPLFGIVQAICLATCSGSLSYLFDSVYSMLRMNTISHTLNKVVSRPSAVGFFATFKQEIQERIVGVSPETVIDIGRVIERKPVNTADTRVIGMGS